MFESDPQSEPQTTSAAAEPSQPTPPPPGPAATVPDYDTDWSRGKSREQLVREMDEFYAALPHLDLSAGAPAPAGYAPSAAPSHPEAPVNGSPTTPLPPDLSLAQTDPEEWARRFDAYNRHVIQQTLATAAGEYSRPLMESQAQTARELSRRDPRNTEIWSRYGPEIDREMARVPVGSRTKSAYDQCCDLIRGRHFEELAAQRSQPKQPPNATISDTGAEAVPTEGRKEDRPLDTFWDSDHFYVRRLKDSGMSKTAIREKIRAMDLTEEQWVNGVKGGSFIVTSDGNRQQVAGA